MKALRILMICLWSIIGLAILGALVYSLIFGHMPGVISLPGVSFEAQDTDMELVVDKSFPVSDIHEIEIDLSSDDCEIYTTSASDITVRHYVQNIPESRYIRAEKDGGTLTVRKGMGGFNGISFFVFSRSLVEVYIPESYARELDAGVTSGNITIENGMSLKELSLHTSSGDIRAEELLKAERAEIDVTSGNISLIKGLETEGYSIKVSSGNVTVDDRFTGSGKVKVTSGNVDLFGVEIAENLSVDVSSGDVEIELAGDPGLEFNAKKTSGDISAYFDIDKDSWHSYSATIGSAPYKELDVEVTSGNVRITRG